MKEQSIKILLIEDNPGDARLVHEMLNDIDDVTFDLVHVDRLSKGLGRLAENETDIVLLDLNLPDSSGFETFTSLNADFPHVPCVVLTGASDQCFPIKTVKTGAQDYLVKGEINGHILISAIRFAIERHRLKQEVKTTNLRMQSIINKNFDGILAINRSGIIHFANPAAEKIFNEKSENLIGQSFGFPMLTGESTEIEIANKSGKMKIVEMYVDEADWENETSHLIYLHDITEKRQAEIALQESAKRYRSLLELSKEPIIIHDMNGRILDANNTALETFEPDRKLFQNMTFQMLAFPQGLPLIERLLKELPTQKYTHYESEMKKTDGTSMQTQMYSTLIDQEKGIIQTIIYDLTEPKRLERERIEHSKLKSLSGLAAGLAHDFNNLLTAILGNLSFIQISIEPSNKIQTLLSDANDAILKARDLSLQIISLFSGIDPVKKWISILELFEDLMKKEMADISIDCEFLQEDDPWLVEFDETGLRNVLINLILNAHEAMTDGGTILVRVQNLTLEANHAEPLTELRKGKYLKIAIQDKGIGIPEENLPFIFDPYFSTKPRGSQKGMGLGLTKVYSIMTKNGGYIYVNSKEGAGTKVYLYLPVSESKKGGERKRHAVASSA